jgi:hypothetical protein
MDIPREMQVRFGIAPGAVYIIEKDGDVHEHYFVVLNLDPKNDENILLVSATTKHQNEQRYIALRQFGESTLVKVGANESAVITKESTFNCNRYIDPTLGDLCNSITMKRVDYIGAVIEPAILEKLREATLQSPLLRAKYRGCLKEDSD